MVGKLSEIMEWFASIIYENQKEELCPHCGIVGSRYLAEYFSTGLDRRVTVACIHCDGTIRLVHVEDDQWTD